MEVLYVHVICMFWRPDSPRLAIRCDIDGRAWHSRCAACISCMSGWRAQQGSSSAVSSQQTLYRHEMRYCFLAVLPGSPTYMTV